jgi:hypothetical protein
VQTNCTRDIGSGRSSEAVTVSRFGVEKASLGRKYMVWIGAEGRYDETFWDGVRGPAFCEDFTPLPPPPPFFF